MTTDTNPSKSTPRLTPREEAPYVWCSAIALKRIREQVGTTKGATAIAVYIALCDIANDQREPAFESNVNAIAHKAAMGYRATWQALQSLEQVGVIQIHNPGTKIIIRNGKERRVNASGEASKFTLLSFAQNAKGGMHEKPRRYANEDRVRVQRVSNKNPHKGDSKREEDKAAPLGASPSAATQGDAQGGADFIGRF